MSAFSGGASEEDEKKEVKEQKEPVSVGIEQIRKVAAYYCELCKMYVGRGSEETMPPILTRHCKLRTHMQRYIRYKEHKNLEKRAEKLQRKETAEKVDKEKSTNLEESIKNDTAEDETEIEAETKTAEDESVKDDKLWTDKDLEDSLTKDGNKSSDEDEDVNGERYDR